MPAGGTITISTTKTEWKGKTSVLLRFSDTGKEIETALISRLFEPQFKTAADKELEELELPNVYAIVKKNGGDIAVVSQPGEGTAFQIYLPSAQEKAGLAKDKT